MFTLNKFKENITSLSLLVGTTVANSALVVVLDKVEGCVCAVQLGG